MERSDDDEGYISKDHPPDDEDPEFVEMDPTGRYGRYNEVLGKGAYKTVYKAFDELDGIEVAWNQVSIQDTLRNSGDMERLYSELHLLKMLKHQNIIKFCNSWVDTRCKNVNFITEIFTSGTLRQYRKKHKHVKMKAIKHWARQILQGLVYLHSHEPPIIHRDLKCDNIFINGNSGEVKIGDLGLAVILSQAPAAHSVIGTPEFMAPELYEEHYNELVDIYSFGMCLLEILTFEYPYSECTNAAQIYKKVTSGKRPAALNKVKDLEMREFVEKCLASASERLHAEELLKDPFLLIEEDPEAVECCQAMTLDPDDDLKELNPATKESLSQEDTGKAYGRMQNKLSEEGSAAEPNAISSDDCVLDSPRQKVVSKRNRDFRIKVKQQDENKVLVRFRITSSRGGVRYIQFDFDLQADTAMSVASEMVIELDLSDQDATIIAGMIDAELVALFPDWRPECYLEEAGGDEKQQELVLENPEVQGLRADVPSVTLRSADNLEVDPDSRNEVLVYGRFEEVGCNLVGSLHTQQELDGLGSFSDFSSEHFEGGGSDLSLDASSDRLNAEIIVDDRLATQDLEGGVNADVRMEPSFALKQISLVPTEEDFVRESLPLLDLDQKLDGDTGTEELRVLVFQQKQEIQLLQSKHNRELLELKTNLNKEAHTSMDRHLSMKRSSMQVIDDVLVHSSTKNRSESSEYMSNLIDEVSQSTCKDGRLQSDMTMNELDTLGTVATSEASINPKFDEKKTFDTHTQLESSFMQLIEKSEIKVMANQDNAATEDYEQVKGPVHVVGSCNDKIVTSGDFNAFSSKEYANSGGGYEQVKGPVHVVGSCNDKIVTSGDFNAFSSKEYANSGGGLASTASAIANSGENESKCDQSLDSTCKSGAFHLPVSATQPDSKGSLTLKREWASLTKRESYLEFYKAGLNPKDKMHATNDAVCKSSDSKDDNMEPVRKLLLQKSIANLEAKTLQGLSQSSSSYLVKNASKTNAGGSVHNNQSQVQLHKMTDNRG